jgi:hypothetical protein
MSTNKASAHKQNYIWDNKVEWVKLKLNKFKRFFILSKIVPLWIDEDCEYSSKRILFIFNNEFLRKDLL